DNFCDFYGNHIGKFTRQWVVKEGIRQLYLNASRDFTCRNDDLILGTQCVVLTRQRIDRRVGGSENYVVAKAFIHLNFEDPVLFVFIYTTHRNRNQELVIIVVGVIIDVISEDKRSNRILIGEVSGCVIVIREIDFLVFTS